MARMRPRTERIDDPDVEAGKLPLGLRVEAAHIGRIGEAAEAEGERRDAAVELSDRQCGEGTPLPFDRHRLAGRDQMRVRERRIFAARRRREAIAEARLEPRHRGCIGVDIDAPLHVHDEAAEIVDAVDMVGMRMRVEHAVELADPGGKRLLAKVRAGIDQHVGDRRRSEIRCASSEQRRRRFFGLLGSQTPQSPPIRGTPGDEPQPEHREAIDARSSRPQRRGTLENRRKKFSRCQRCDLLTADAAHVRQHVRRVHDERRLVPLSAMRRRREIRRVGLHQNPIRWKIARYVSDFLRILERQDARKRDIMAERNSGLGERPSRREAVQDSRESPLLRLALQDRR